MRVRTRDLIEVGLVTYDKGIGLHVMYNGLVFCQCFLHRQDIGWSRSRVPVPRWFCKIRRTIKHTISYSGSGSCYKVIVTFHSEIEYNLVLTML
jgi:hypothetical protein